MNLRHDVPIVLLVVGLVLGALLAGLGLVMSQ